MYRRNVAVSSGPYEVSLTSHETAQIMEWAKSLSWRNLHAQAGQMVELERLLSSFGLRRGPFEEEEEDKEERQTKEYRLLQEKYDTLAKAMSYAIEKHDVLLDASCVEEAQELL